MRQKDYRQPLTEHDHRLLARVLLVTQLALSAGQGPWVSTSLIGRIEGKQSAHRLMKMASHGLVQRRPMRRVGADLWRITEQGSNLVREWEAYQ